MIFVSRANPQRLIQTKRERKERNIKDQRTNATFPHEPMNEYVVITKDNHYLKERT